MEGKKRDWNDLFEEATEAMSQWRARHRRATFNEIESTVDEELARVRARLLQDLALASASRDWSGQRAEERPKCPECGRALQSNGRRRRDLVTNQEQAIELRRSHGRCPECRTSFFPPG